MDKKQPNQLIIELQSGLSAAFIARYALANAALALHGFSDSPDAAALAAEARELRCGPVASWLRKRVKGSSNFYSKLSNLIKCT